MSTVTTDRPTYKWVCHYPGGCNEWAIPGDSRLCERHEDRRRMDALEADLKSLDSSVGELGEKLAGLALELDRILSMFGSMKQVLEIDQASVANLTEIAVSQANVTQQHGDQLRKVIARVDDVESKEHSRDFDIEEHEKRVSALEDSTARVQG